MNGNCTETNNCGFCGKRTLVAVSEQHGVARICEECADWAICQFMEAQHAPKKKAKRST